jgi:hypothetical protein
MNILGKIKSMINYLPSLYDTRYSRIFALYELQIDLNTLKCNVIVETRIKQIFLHESPHSRCALECLGNYKKINTIINIDRELIAEYVEANSLVYCIQYINYIKQAHPETDAIESFVNFLNLMQLCLRSDADYTSRFCVLARKLVDPSGNRFWLLIDGLHRSSILFALNKSTVRARVKFP